MANYLPAKKNHTLLLTALLLAASFCAKSQRTTPAPTQSAKAPATKPNPDSVNARIENRLVELAIQGPQYRGSEHQNKINEYQLRAAKNTWLNLLAISANYNDQTFANHSTVVNGVAQPNIYPKYYFGITIPLGLIFSHANIRSARESLELSKTNQEQLARTLRAEVLGKYLQYKNYGELIRLQAIVTNDAQAAFLQTEDKFRICQDAAKGHLYTRFKAAALPPRVVISH